MFFLKKIFNSCAHKWTILSRTYVHSEFGCEKIVCVMSCTKCGKIKKVKIT